jgi:hypothetical protein
VVINGQEYDPFMERVKRSAHEPIAETIIDVYVDSLFGQVIDRSPVRTALGDEVFNDIDLKGNKTEHFLAYVFAQGLALGWGAILTDMPRIEPDSVPSRLHELADGRRPYCRWVPPTRIWQWTMDPVTQEFTSALIHESENRFRFWTPDSYTLLDDKAEPVPGGQGEHGFGRVPLTLFIAAEPDIDDENAPIGVSAIKSSALMQLQVDQHASLLDDVQRKTNFPFLHVRDDIDQTEDGDIPQDETLGADYMFQVEAEVNWIAPPAVCAEQARAHIDRLESRIYKAQGVHRRSQDSVEAHSGLALDWESAPIYRTVQAWAQRLYACELRLWRTVADIMGASLPEDPVTYPEDFSSRPVDLDYAHTKELKDIYGGYGSAPQHAKRVIDMKVARATERDLSSRPSFDELVTDFESIDYGAESVSQDTALNGAQVTAASQILKDVTAGLLPRETGVEALTAFFPLDKQTADRIMGPAGDTFFAKEENPEPATVPPSLDAPPSPSEDGGAVVSSDSEGEEDE